MRAKNVNIEIIYFVKEIIIIKSYLQIGISFWALKKYEFIRHFPDQHCLCSKSWKIGTDEK